MNRSDRLSTAWLLLACGMVCALLVVAMLPAWVWAQSNDLPPRPPTATPTDMPVDRPTPFPTEKPEIRPQPAEPAEAWIELHCQLPAQSLSLSWPELWTAVQWQDSDGRWHDVEGWRGKLDQVVNGVGKKVWWVAEKDLGTGPFRWVVRRGEGGELLAASAPFHLPGTGEERQRVGVVLTP